MTKIKDRASPPKVSIPSNEIATEPPKHKPPFLLISRNEKGEIKFEAAGTVSILAGTLIVLVPLIAYFF